MSIEKATQAVWDFSEKIFKKPCQVVSVKKKNRNWLAEIEVIAEDEYMIRRGRDETVALYEVVLDEDFGVISYNRIGLRERGLVGASILNQNS